MRIAWPQTAPWRETLEHELLAFPTGGHDDCVDVLSYAAGELARGRFGEVTASIATGRIVHSWERGDPAADFAARHGAVLYDSTAARCDRLPVDVQVGIDKAESLIGSHLVVVPKRELDQLARPRATRRRCRAHRVADREPPWRIPSSSPATAVSETWRRGFASYGRPFAKS